MSSSTGRAANRLAFNPSNRVRIGLLGSGWGAFQFLKKIDHLKYKCFVISPRNHMLFTPLLASAVVGTTNVSSICESVRPLVQKRNGKYYEAKAFGINKEENLVHCEAVGGGKFDLKYDKLVIGVGFQANDFEIPEVDKYAFFMKETADASRLHNHILLRFETAASILHHEGVASPDEIKSVTRLLTFVIVGGGLSGVELTGEMNDFMRKDVRRQYPFLEKYVSIHLVDGSPLLLQPFNNEYLQNYARRSLKDRGVKIHLDAPVKGITETTLTLVNGSSIDFGTLIWCAGIKPYPFTRDLDVAKNEWGSQILVDGHLKIKGESNLWAIGDCATIDGNWLPQTAQAASQQAIYLANEFNKAGDTEHKVEEFKYHDKGMMTNLGGRTAMIKLPFSSINKITGFPAYLGWRAGYWTMQLSMRNRYFLTVDWIKTAIFGRDLYRKGDISNMQN